MQNRRPPATACRPNRKSAGAILKSWKAASRRPRADRTDRRWRSHETGTADRRAAPAARPDAADMRQQPTQLTEVPWNEQTPAQRQQTLQRQRLAQQQQQAQQQQWAQTQAQTVQQQPPRVQQPKPVQQQQPKQTASNQQPYRDLLQTPAHTNTTQPRTQAAAPVTQVEEAPKTTAEKKDDRSWMIQCGSLKAPSRPKPSALSWLSKGLLRTLPLTTAGTAWLLAR